MKGTIIKIGSTTHYDILGYQNDILCPQGSDTTTGGDPDFIVITDVFT